MWPPSIDSLWIAKDCCPRHWNEVIQIRGNKPWECGIKVFRCPEGEIFINGPRFPDGNYLPSSMTKEQLLNNYELLIPIQGTRLNFVE